MFFNRGSSRNPSSSAKANPTTDAPWVSIQLVPMSRDMCRLSASDAYRSRSASS
jgi:hypothetical protein